jgi:hypothetical protein
MQFTNEVAWNLFDFIVMGILLFSTTSIFVILARKLPKHRFAIAIILLLGFLYVWAELTVGIFTNLES